MSFWAAFSFYNPKNQTQPVLKFHPVIPVDLQAHRYQIRLANHAVQFVRPGYIIQKTTNLISIINSKTIQNKFKHPLKLS